MIHTSPGGIEPLRPDPFTNLSYRTLARDLPHYAAGQAHCERMNPESTAAEEANRCHSEFRTRLLRTFYPARTALLAAEPALIDSLLERAVTEALSEQPIGLVQCTYLRSLLEQLRFSDGIPESIGSLAYESLKRLGQSDGISFDHLDSGWEALCLAIPWDTADLDDLAKWYAPKALEALAGDRWINQVHSTITRGTGPETFDLLWRKVLNVPGFIHSAYAHHCRHLKQGIIAPFVAVDAIAALDEPPLSLAQPYLEAAEHYIGGKFREGRILEGINALAVLPRAPDDIRKLHSCALDCISYLRPAVWSAVLEALQGAGIKPGIALPDARLLCAALQHFGMQELRTTDSFQRTVKELLKKLPEADNEEFRYEMYLLLERRRQGAFTPPSVSDEYLEQRKAEALFGDEIKKTIGTHSWKLALEQVRFAMSGGLREEALAMFAALEETFPQVLENFGRLKLWVAMRILGAELMPTPEEREYSLKLLVRQLTAGRADEVFPWGDYPGLPDIVHPAKELLAPDPSNPEPRSIDIMIARRGRLEESDLADVLGALKEEYDRQGRSDESAALRMLSLSIRNFVERYCRGGGAPMVEAGRALLNAASAPGIGEAIGVERPALTLLLTEFAYRLHKMEGG